jgi:hypothetical protein
LTGTLIAVTIALAILALFVTAITIRRTLSSFVIAHPRGRVVALVAGFLVNFLERYKKITMVFWLFSTIEHYRKYNSRQVTFLLLNVFSP